MEIKARLISPYTETQKMDFIVKYNHQLGYTINQTPTDIEAWGYTEEEITEQKKQADIAELNQKIAELEQIMLVENINKNYLNVEVIRETKNSLIQTRNELIGDIV